MWLFSQKTKENDACAELIGLPPETQNTLQKLAESTHNDGTVYTTIANKLSQTHIHHMCIQKRNIYKTLINEIIKKHLQLNQQLL